MITIVQLLNLAATEVESSGAITTFLEAQYPDSTLTTYVGYDGSNPPSESDCPFVVFAPSLRPYDVGSGVIERTPTITILWGVNDSRTSTEGSRITLTGLVNADTFGGLILAAINNVAGAGAVGQQAVREVQYSLDDSSRFPLIQGGMDVTFWFPQGADEASLS